MFKKIVLFLLLVAMSISAYAGGNTLEITKNYDLPEGMKDCRVFQLTDGLFTPVLFITKCPLAKTSTSNLNNKSTAASSVVDYVDEDVPVLPDNNIIEINGKRYKAIN